MRFSVFCLFIASNTAALELPKKKMNWADKLTAYNVHDAFHLCIEGNDQIISGDVKLQ